MDWAVLTVVLVIAVVAGAWGVLAVAFALLAGGIIHARDHRDMPYGGPAARGIAETAAIVPLGPRLR